MPKPASEHDIVMVLVVVGHLQKRSALQAEKADHFELRKTTARLLTAILRPLELAAISVDPARDVGLPGAAVAQSRLLIVIGFDGSHYGENQKNQVGCAVHMFPDVPFMRVFEKS